ncbi:TATA box-binding protein-associated factor RNA polymerase I subunit C isoform X2 [Synchiropus splendidus]|uniref:TATA box-binding protein-associated factor RNA polymerase I subunit C isoform X2 n=1 Tax=Synchiropus splendidus TaxID=270530 RepID=UPI00237E978A|nr:TATA box-binding protein-associated factor RNA polymerase I subunit C isoform X2 [Synchiropus splendidus]XP_053709485.1 TATA box-binding protein-associated factor RNA polymerase I subunit C isoform X2 [Synchiropus splendidus]
MDYHFPKQLFPSFYNSGRPDPTIRPTGGGTWGSYDRLIPQGGSGSSWTFSSRHRPQGETWCHTEPVPIPLFTPQKSLWSSTIPHPLQFKEHMENFYLDHVQDAFGCMSSLIYENLASKSSRKTKKNAVQTFLQNIQKNPQTESFKCPKFKACSGLLCDVVPDIPPELLGTLLYEELTEQRDEKLFSEKATGGALAFIPFSDHENDSEQGCLLYPGDQGLNCLNFHRIALQHRGRSSFHLDTTSSPYRVQLQAPVRQISFASLSSEHCVAVRSDHVCGVWKYSENQDPCLLQAVKTKEKASCISASPHVLGEVLVASESGAAHLWTAGKRMQKVREENDNLYFNANSQWRWCEFTAHPRVMTYADRTGAELTDIRMSPVSFRTLFRISRTADCHAGERLITCRYLRDVHPFHHIVATQYSAYLLDERFPCVPMLKMDHMMQSPPVFCHVSSGVGTTKVLLGSQSSQEITLLQYSGGRMEASSSWGPPQALLCPRDSLKLLPVQIPHRQATTRNRLSSPAAGLTRVQQKPSGRKGSEDKCLCVLQLTEDGDLFYQTLAMRDFDSSSRSHQEDVAYDSQTERQSSLVRQSQATVSETSSDEDIIGPSQFAHGGVSLTNLAPRVEESCSDSDFSSDDSHSRRKRRHLKGLRNLEVVVNLDPELKQGNESNDHEGEVTNHVQSSDALDTVSHLDHPDLAKLKSPPAKLTDNALLTWKRWLQKLVRRTNKVKQRHSYMLHDRVAATGLLSLSPSKLEDLSEKLDLPSLRREMKECMASRSLLTSRGTTSSPNSVVAFPDVDTNQWQDHLSERLTLSWQGEEAWRDWWKDHLGLNRDKKLEALRSKRRREKAVRRAKGQVSLSESFSSSYVTDSEYLSDSSGWCSQRTWSDMEELGSLSQLKGSEEQRTPQPSQCDAARPSTVSTPQHLRVQSESLMSPGRSHVLSQSQKFPKVSNPTGLAGSPVKTPRKSLLADQPDWFSQDEVTEAPHPSRVTPLLTTSQSSSLGNFEISASQTLSDFSQSSTRTSQWRARQSQSSQPKKKSRMGF